MPLYDLAFFSVVRAATGEFATIASVIQTLYIYFFYQYGRFVNKIYMSEEFAHFMQWEPFYYRKHRMGIIDNHCPIVSRTDFQSA